MSQNYYPSQSLPNNTNAIISLVTGILGLTFFPLVGSIIALITGYMARKEIDANPGMMGGAGMATAGIILGWVGVGLAVLGGCIFGLVLLIPICLVPLGLSTMEYNTIILSLLEFFL